MKDLRYASLKKRKKTFYKNLGTIRTDNKSKKTLEYIARRSYEALPSKMKRYVDDVESKISFIANEAKYHNEGFDFYQAFVKNVEGHPKYAWHTNREKIWAAFKTQRPDVYAQYLSYMRRRGLSGTYFWYDNVEIDHAGKIEYCELDLNLNTGYDVDKAVVFYGTLYIEYNHSNDVIEEAYMQ